MAVQAFAWNDSTRQIAAQEIDLTKFRLMKLSVSTAAKQATATISIATPGVVTWNGHGLANGHPVFFTTTGVLPTGLSPNVIYYAKSVTTNTFELAATAGGASLATAGGQSGVHTAKAAFDPTNVTMDQVAGGSKAVATITIATPGVVTWNGHGLANGTPVTLRTTGALPTGLAVDTVYYVKNQTTNTFELAATGGGASINTTGSQSGVHTAWSNGSFEVYGNGWSPFGESVANVLASTITTNDAKVAGDQTSKTASGGDLRARFVALFNFARMKPFILYDLGQEEIAGETTDFKLTFDLTGKPGTIFNISNPA